MWNFFFLIQNCLKRENFTKVSAFGWEAAFQTHSKRQKRVKVGRTKRKALFVYHLYTISVSQFKHLKKKVYTVNWIKDKKTRFKW